MVNNEGCMDDYNSGQVGLVLILVAAAVGAVTMSIASRSTTGLRTQEIEVESSQAFRAAEAGLEKALSLKQSGASPVIDELVSGGSDLSYKTSVVAQGAGGSGFITSSVFNPGQVLQITVSGVSGGLRLYWSSDVSANAAVKISLYDGDPIYKLEYYAYGSAPCVSGFSPSLGSASFTADGETVNFSDYQDINLSGSVELVRVLVLCSATRLGIAPLAGVSLPSQGLKIKSVGKENTSNVSRAVEVTELPGQLPIVFDNVLFSAGAIAQ